MADDATQPAHAASDTTADVTPRHRKAPTPKRGPGAPLPRDHRGWDVAPATDGRGMPQTNQPPPHRTRGFLYFVVALLAINVLLSFVFDQTSTQPRVTVPFSPFFLSEVRAGKVASITTTGDSVQGTFKKKVIYPANSNTTPTTLFATQVPAFWPGNQLESLLSANHVQINAKSTTQSTSTLADILLSFGPTLLFIGLIVFFLRRPRDGRPLGDERADRPDHGAAERVAGPSCCPARARPRRPPSSSSTRRSAGSSTNPTSASPNCSRHTATNSSR
jgi:cell division protease FtsH